MKKLKSFLIRKCEFGSVIIGFEKEPNIFKDTTFQMADSKGIEFFEFITNLKDNQILKISEVTANGTTKK